MSLWRVEFRESGRTTFDNYVVAVDGGGAALSSLCSFYEQCGPGGVDSGGSDELILQHMITGGHIVLHPTCYLVVGLHNEHLRRGASGLEAMQSYEGEALLELVHEARGGRESARLQRYIGTIYQSERGRGGDAGSHLFTSGCLGVDRGHALELISHDYLGRHYGDRDWRIRIFEYHACADSSGYLIEGAMRAEAFGDEY